MRIKGLILAMGTVMTAGMGSSAFAAMDMSDALALCSRITKADARVECYDQVARDSAAGLIRTGPAPQQPGTYAAPAPAPAAQAQQPNWASPPASIAQGNQRAQGPAAQASGGFGAEALPRNAGGRPEDGPDRISAAVASSTDNGLGQWRIKLADGAVWQMTERTPYFRPPAPNETVTIKKGAMGGFLMDVGQQASVRVRRVL